jgi:endonuclease/exonuclease/phosphatase family metal-dependent hydrolase
VSINKKSIILKSDYNPPLKIIERDLDLLAGTGHKVIFAGDFNAKSVTWRARQNNAATQCRLNYCYINNYTISLPSQPTHLPGRNLSGAKVLNFAIISNVLSSHSVRTVGRPSTSDRSPILLAIRGPLVADETKPNFIYREVN